MKANYPHISQHETLAAGIVGFVRYARENGLPVGVNETSDALRAAEMGTVDRSETFAYALKSIFCTCPEEGDTFDSLFAAYWGERKMAVKSKTTYRNQSNLQKKSPGSLVWMGMGDQDTEESEDAKNVSGANHTERLRKTDFSKISEMDSQLLEELALKLWRQMSLRMKRRRKLSATQGIPDLRKTIRNSLSYGGEPFELMRKKRIPRKQRLVILLDVSGSMDKYSFFLLRFIWSLRAHFESVEGFIFSTHLIRITDFLDRKDLERTLSFLTIQANNWSGGTRIGACFKDFNQLYARQVLAGNSTTIILSDGLDTGEPEDLATELAKIRRRTRRLIWLNPLKGMSGYEPTQRGMSAALPEIDIFNSAHNLNSLLELEKYLGDVS